MTDIQQALRAARETLQPTSPSARLDAEVLLAHVLNQTRTYLYAYTDKRLSEPHHQQFQKLITQRAEGHPIPYLTGHKEFWSLDFLVNEHTLIPRPSTETLVSVTLEWVRHQKNPNILDLGTGCGAVAIALASEIPQANIIAVDKDPLALATAQENAKRHGIKTISFRLSDWFSQVPEQSFDAIVSNPPYICENDPHLKQGDVHFEPPSALISGPDGLNDLKIIIHNSKSHLNSNGVLLVEHGFQQKSQIQSILMQCQFTQVQTWKDCEGNERVSGGKC